MTLTERAWELVVASINVAGEDTFALAPENAFEVAKKFEAEAAKHEAPKTDGEVWYAAAWFDEYGDFTVSDTTYKTQHEMKIVMADWKHDKVLSIRKCFLVEVRRVK